jgi:hypothetical protein
MRGFGTRNIFSENNLAHSATKITAKWRKTRTQLCWKCQKDKPIIKGVTLDSIEGFTSRSLVKFICFECKEAKLKEQK